MDGCTHTQHDSTSELNSSRKIKVEKITHSVNSSLQRLRIRIFETCPRKDRNTDRHRKKEMIPTDQHLASHKAQAENKLYCELLLLRGIFLVGLMLLNYFIIFWQIFQISRRAQSKCRLKPCSNTLRAWF